MRAEAAVLREAADNHGIITRRRAMALGLSARQVDRRLRLGVWVPLHPGVYRVAGAPITGRQALAGAVAWTGGVASHRSAGALHGLMDPPPRPQVTVGRSASGRRPGVRIHRTADLAPGDVVVRDGIRCTSATRTCIDLGAVLGADELERLISRALHLHLTHLDRLVVRFLQLRRPGRTGSATVREVLCRLDPTLAPAESDLEALLIQALRRRGAPEPVRQHPVEIAGRRFRIDLCYPAHRLAIECDGFAHHGHRTAFEDDRLRQNLLVLDGWRVLRFTWRQVCRDPDGTAEQVRQALGMTPP